MYVNAKMIPVETIPCIWGRVMKERFGGCEFKYDIVVHCKNLCKCHNVPSPSTKIIEKNKVSISEKYG
jgi:hypothetical protein